MRVTAVMADIKEFTIPWILFHSLTGRWTHLLRDVTIRPVQEFTFFVSVGPKLKVIHTMTCLGLALAACKRKVFERNSQLTQGLERNSFFLGAVA